MFVAINKNKKLTFVTFLCASLGLESTKGVVSLKVRLIDSITYFLPPRDQFDSGSPGLSCSRRELGKVGFYEDPSPTGINGTSTVQVRLQSQPPVSSSSPRGDKSEGRGKGSSVFK